MWFLQQSWPRELSLRRRPIQMKQVRDIKDHWNNQDHKPEVFPGHQIKSIYRVWWVNSQCATTQDILGYCSFKGISFTMLKPPQACNMPRLLGSKHQLLSDTRHFQRFSMLKDHQHDLFTHGCLLEYLAFLLKLSNLHAHMSSRVVDPTNTHTTKETTSKLMSWRNSGLQCEGTQERPKCCSMCVAQGVIQDSEQTIWNQPTN